MQLEEVRLCEKQLTVAQAGTSGIHQCQANSVSQVNGNHRFGTQRLGRRRVQQRNNGVSQHFHHLRELP